MTTKYHYYHYLLLTLNLCLILISLPYWLAFSNYFILHPDWGSKKILVMYSYLLVGGVTSARSEHDLWRNLYQSGSKHLIKLIVVVQILKETYLEQCLALTIESIEWLLGAQSLHKLSLFLQGLFQNNVDIFF